MASIRSYRIIGTTSNIILSANLIQYMENHQFHYNVMKKWNYLQLLYLTYRSWWKVKFFIGSYLINISNNNTKNEKDKNWCCLRNFFSIHLFQTIKCRNLIYFAVPLFSTDEVMMKVFIITKSKTTQYEFEILGKFTYLYYSCICRIHVT